MDDKIARVFADQQEGRWEAKTSSVDERRALLARLRAAVMSQADAAMTALHADLRRPLGDQPDLEVTAVLQDIDQAAAELDQWMAPTLVTGSFGD